MMHYYSHNIGDYAQATNHLSLVEDAVYTRLLRRYYAEETPIVDDLQQVCRWVGARSEEDRAAVPVVLAEFFDLLDGFWRNKRADEEIAKYHDNREAKSAAGKASAASRSRKNDQTHNEASTPVQQALNECATNQEPITINQEPIDQKTCTPSACELVAEDMFPKFWALYPNKKGKEAAQKAWKKLKVTDELFTLITSGLAKQVVCADWTKDSGQFIPHPATWLNGKRWEDEVKVVSNVHQLPLSRHTLAAERDYKAGTKENANGTFRI